jgi:hypothetical protein
MPDTKANPAREWPLPVCRNGEATDYSRGRQQLDIEHIRKRMDPVVAVTSVRLIPESPTAIMKRGCALTVETNLRGLSARNHETASARVKPSLVWPSGSHEVWCGDDPRLMRTLKVLHISLYRATISHARPRPSNHVLKSELRQYMGNRDLFRTERDRNRDG